MVITVNTLLAEPVWQVGYIHGVLLHCVSSSNYFWFTVFPPLVCLSKVCWHLGSKSRRWWTRFLHVSTSWSCCLWWCPGWSRGLWRTGSWTLKRSYMPIIPVTPASSKNVDICTLTCKCTTLCFSVPVSSENFSNKGCFLLVLLTLSFCCPVWQRPCHPGKV